MTIHDLTQGLACDRLETARGTYLVPVQSTVVVDFVRDATADDAHTIVDSILLELVEDVAKGSILDAEEDTDVVDAEEDTDDVAEVSDAAKEAENGARETSGYGTVDEYLSEHPSLWSYRHFMDPSFATAHGFDNPWVIPPISRRDAPPSSKRWRMCTAIALHCLV